MVIAMIIKRYSAVLAFALFCAFVIIHVLLTNHSFALDYTESATLNEAFYSQGSKYSIIYDNGIRHGSMNDYDATNKYVYFAYSEHQSLVDVFNDKGDYLFSIQFVDQAKGVISIRCMDDFLFVSLKNGAVLVFDEATLISEYDKSAAREIGYDYVWFNEPSSAIALQGLNFYRIDAVSNQKHKLDISIWIILGFYKQYMIIAVISVAIVVLAAKRISSNRKSIKKENQ